MSGKMALLARGVINFALPVEGIAHIVTLPEVFVLPLLPSWVGGVFLYKDQVTPLVDLDSLWTPGLGGKNKKSPYTVVCNCEFGLVGLPVDQVLHIVDLDPELVKTLDEASSEAPCGFDRLFVRGDREYPVLSVDSLLFSMPPKTITRHSPTREPRRLG